MTSRQLSSSVRSHKRQLPLVAFGIAALCTKSSDGFTINLERIPVAPNAYNHLESSALATSFRLLKPLSMANSETQEEETSDYAYVEDPGAFVVEKAPEGGFVPTPPSYAPAIDAQLEADLFESERRVMLYEKEIEKLREEVVLKTEQLEEEQGIFREEKSNLVDKIIEFTTLLAQRDEELEQRASQETRSAESDEKEKQLKKDVANLKKKLEEKTTQYNNELQATKELKRRFEEATDALEFGQMEFKKQKDALQSAIEKEKGNVRALERKLQDTQSNFNSVREELLNKIKIEQYKLTSTRGMWDSTNKALEKAQEKLQSSVDEREASLKASQKELKARDKLFDSERDELKEKILLEQEQVRVVRRELKAEKSRFEKSKKQLEAVIQDEKQAVEKLQEDMVREQGQFENQKNSLEKRIREESDRLAKVEQELAGERDRYTQLQEEMKVELAKGVEARELQNQKMEERYRNMRDDMRKKWQSTRRDSLQEQERLKNKYERKLNDVQKKVSRLESDLGKSEESSKELTARLVEAEAQKQLILSESASMAAKYKDSLQQRDVEIGSLQENIVDLQTTIRKKDVIIEEQRKTLGRYETSFRAVAGLSMKVTGNKLRKAETRLRKAGSSVKRLLKKSSEKETEEE